MSTMNTDCWEILGMTPTTCQSRIQKAYTRLLCLNEPESFPRLRDAQKAALAAARTLKQQAIAPSSSPSEHMQQQVHPAADTPASTNVRQTSTPTCKPTHETFTAETAALYADFERRVKIREWQQLLASPVLQEPKDKHRLRIWLFGFFDSHFYLPQPVLDLLRETFEWVNHYDALTEAHGQDTVDTLLDFFEYNRWYIRFEHLQPPASWTTEQIDHYLQQRERLAIANRKGDQQAFANRLSALQEADITDIALHFWLALQYLANKQLHNALDQIQQLEIHAPERLDTQLLSGRINQLMQQPHAAAAAFRAVLKIDDRHVLATKGLADYYLQTGYSHEARALYRRILELTPFDMEARVQIMLINQAIIGTAFSDLAPKPCSLEHCCEIAQCYLQNADYDNCVRFVTQISLLARRNDVTLPQALSDSPFSDLYQALLARPDGLQAEDLPARLYEYQGDACKALGDHMNALMLYKHAAALAKTQGENAVAARLRWAQTEQEDYQDFGAALEVAISLCEDAPACAEAWYIQGYSLYQQALEQQDSIENALPSINQAINLEPENWRYHSARALILFDLGLYAEALADTDITLRSQQNFSWAWYRKAVCLRELGNLEAAAEAFETSIEQVTAAQQAAEALAWLAIEQGWPEKAHTALQTYIDHDGDQDSIAELTAAIDQCSRSETCTQSQHVSP